MGMARQSTRRNAAPYPTVTGSRMKMETNCRENSVETTALVRETASEMAVHSRMADHMRFLRLEA